MGKCQRKHTEKKQQREKIQQVILHEENRNYARDRNKPVRGMLFLKIEPDCMTLQVKTANLGPCSSENRVYKLILLGRHNGSSVYKFAGELHPDEHGNAEFSACLKADDEDGILFSDYFIFMIAAMSVKDCRLPLQPVLKGDINWAARSAAVTENQEEIKNDAAKAERNQKNYNSFYNEYLVQKISEIISKGAAGENVEPFAQPWLAERWCRTADPEKLPVASEDAKTQAERYGHFLWAYDEKYFYLAVPGKNDPKQQPDSGRSGFYMWNKLKNSEEYGYWCMVIGRKNGIITEIS